VSGGAIRVFTERGVLASTIRNAQRIDSRTDGKGKPEEGTCRCSEAENNVVLYGATMVTSSSVLVAVTGGR
jgi:hypothetical protein